RFRVDQVRVTRVEGAIRAVATAELDPVFVENPVLGPGGAGADPVRVVLEAAADPVRCAPIHVDAVEFAGGESVLELPAAATGDALVEPAIGAEQKTPRPARVDDEIVVVCVDFLEPILAPSLAAVLRDVEHVTEDVDQFVVRGIDSDLAEVEW